MAKKIETEDGYITVKSTVLDKEKFEVTPIKVRRFASEVARFGLSRRFSKKMAGGDSWITVEVTVQVPCYPEELKQVREQVAALSEEFMAAELEEIEGTVKKKKSTETDDWDDDDE